MVATEVTLFVETVWSIETLRRLLGFGHWIPFCPLAENKKTATRRHLSSESRQKTAWSAAWVDFSSRPGRDCLVWPRGEMRSAASGVAAELSLTRNRT